MMDLVWPVSVKGVLLRHDQVLLLLNERNEWELPGGHVEEGESPKEALAREFQEETAQKIRIGESLGADFYMPIAGDRSLLLLFYVVQDLGGNGDVVISPEHQEMQWSYIDNLPENLPPVYRKAIAQAKSHVWGQVLNHLTARLVKDHGKRMERLQTDLEVVPSFDLPIPRVGALVSAPIASGSIRLLHEDFLTGKKGPVEWVERQIALAKAWQSRTPGKPRLVSGLTSLIPARSGPFGTISTHLC